jgi:Mg/Co/Ni transporter MgtE
VVNEQRVVLGLLRSEQLVSGDEPVQRVMRPGPSTFRPHVPIEEMAHHMIHHELASSPVTTSDGRLVGLLRVEDAARAAHELHVHDSEEGS